MVTFVFFIFVLDVFFFLVSPKTASHLLDNVVYLKNLVAQSPLAEKGPKQYYPSYESQCTRREAHLHQGSA